MTTTPLHDQLTQLWHESLHELTITFLQKLFASNPSLAEMRQALQFAAIQSTLAHIRVGEVLPRLKPVSANASVTPTQLHSATVHTTPRSMPLGRRRHAAPRRRPQQTAQMKTCLLEWLRQEESGIKTPDLTRRLAAGGFKVDTATTHTLLKSLQEDGTIYGDHGRPRLWQAKIIGRSVPEPIIIRRAPVQAQGAVSHEHYMPSQHK